MEHMKCVRDPIQSDNYERNNVQSGSERWETENSLSIRRDQVEEWTFEIIQKWLANAWKAKPVGK